MEDIKQTKIKVYLSSPENNLTNPVALAAKNRFAHNPLGWIMDFREVGLRYGLPKTFPIRGSGGILSQKRGFPAF